MTSGQSLEVATQMTPLHYPLPSNYFCSAKLPYTSSLLPPIQDVPLVWNILL